MYRRLVTFALLVVTVAATVLVIPLALSARDLVRGGNLSALADQARVLAEGWESAATGAKGDDNGAAPVIKLPGDPGEVILVYPNGDVVGGPVPAEAAGVVASAKQGTAASVDTGSSGYATAPAVFDERTGVVLAVASPEQMHEGIEPRSARPGRPVRTAPGRGRAGRLAAGTTHGRTDPQARGDGRCDGGWGPDSPR